MSSSPQLVRKRMGLARLGRPTRVVLTLAALALVVLACLGASTPERPLGDVRSPHRDADGRFFNPWQRYEGGGLWAYLSWVLLESSPYDRSQPAAVAIVPNDGSYLGGVEASATITWVGHATYVVHDRDDVFVTDPHFGQRALFPARSTPPGLPIAAIPSDAFAVISHNHYDHLDEPSVEGMAASVGYYVPLGLADWFRERGRSDVTELDWWQSATRGRFTVTCLPSQHWSLRIGQPTNTTLWCSWLVDSGDYRYYFAGDTGYFPGFAEFGRAWSDIDVAMLPIGTYAPRELMAYQHMDPADAYRAFQDLRARYLLPMHWGTFDLSDEPLDHAPIDLASAVEQAGGNASRVRVMAIGERWKVPAREPSESGAAGMGDSR